MKTHTRAATTLTAVLGAAALLTLSGCDAVTGEKEASYPRASEMKTSDFALQEWIPREATDVNIKVSTTGERSPIAVFKAAQSQLTCDSEVTTVSGTEYAPQLEAGWMPKDAAARATAQCGSFFYFVDGEKIVAWDATKPAYDNPENRMTQTPVPTEAIPTQTQS